LELATPEKPSEQARGPTLGYNRGMATWIAHLRIAENLLAHIPNLDPGQFAIGNLAPDASIPDENWETFSPLPDVTHFKRSQSVHKDIADLDFYREYLADVPISDTPRFSFRLGYFFHLITDNLWTIQVGKPTTERFPEQFAADDKFIWEVKKDWYGLDHIYVREHPDCLYWRVFLEAQPFDVVLPDGDRQGMAASGDLDFLPLEAITRHQGFVKAYYQMENDDIQEMITRPKNYLSKEAMDRFVKDATEKIFHIYQILWPTPPALEGISTSLELLTPDT
jgi:hypothetical protein